MSSHTKDARSRADAEYAKTQTQARERNKAKAERESEAQVADDKTARLRAQRLARDAAEEALPDGVTVDDFEKGPMS